MASLIIDDVIQSTANIDSGHKQAFVEQMVRHKYPFVYYHYCETCYCYEPCTTNDFDDLICLVCLRKLSDYEE